MSCNLDRLKPLKIIFHYNVLVNGLYCKFAFDLGQMQLHGIFIFYHTLKLLMLLWPILRKIFRTYRSIENAYDEQNKMVYPSQLILNFQVQNYYMHVYCL